MTTGIPAPFQITKSLREALNLIFYSYLRSWQNTFSDFFRFLGCLV